MRQPADSASYVESLVEQDATGQRRSCVSCRVSDFELRAFRASYGTRTCKRFWPAPSATHTTQCPLAFRIFSTCASSFSSVKGTSGMRQMSTTPAQPDVRSERAQLDAELGAELGVRGCVAVDQLLHREEHLRDEAGVRHACTTRVVQALPAESGLHCGHPAVSQCEGPPPGEAGVCRACMSRQAIGRVNVLFAEPC